MTKEMEAKAKKFWINKANELLLNKKIVKISWQTETESNENHGWHNRAIQLHLDDGTMIVPQMDDEGNNAGALMWINPNETETHDSYPGEKFVKSRVLPVL